jgi:hypothetical protein
MKLPRYSLRTLLIGIALLSLPMAWTTYQLNWIRQRHAFRRVYGINHYNEYEQAPWTLRLFGEWGVKTIWVPRTEMERTRDLFPEARIMESR